MKPTIHEIAQRVMSDTQYQTPQVKSDFVALLGHIGELQLMVKQFEKTGELQAAINQLETLQANQPQPQTWAVAWLDVNGTEQREFFPVEQRHAAETLFNRLDVTGVQTIEMSQIALINEKKENDNGDH
jgi:hypothetical protein